MPVLVLLATLAVAAGVGCSGGATEWNVLVVVTSDHGESFGENGYLQYGPRVDEPVMRVPLMIRLPSTHPGSHQERSVAQLVRTADIFPTILAALGISSPAGLDGTNLLPLMVGRSMPELWAYGESGREFVGVDPERRLPGVKGKRRMARQDGWKLAYIPDGKGGT